MVNCELVPLAPGVSVAGEKTADAPDGNPLADRVTAFENVPLTGLTLMA
jgi:hypothetical protein